MKKRAWYIALGLLCTATIGGMLFFFLHPSCARAKNSLMFRCAVLSINEETYVSLQELAPFACDSVYAFSPSVTREEMEEVIGFPCEGLQTTQSEGATNLVFLEDGEVVCQIVGTSDTLKFQFVSDETAGGYMHIHSFETLRVTVEQGIRYFKRPVIVVHWDRVDNTRVICKNGGM